MTVGGTNNPSTDAFDQFNFVKDATIPGGSFNQQAFTDNAGPPGQTFTTPGGSTSFSLKTVGYLGAANTSANFGGGVFTAGTTFGVRISSVAGTNLTALLTVTNIATTVGAAGDNWFLWNFTGADVLTLQPSKTYAFEVYSSAGYLGFDAAIAPGSYANGVAFNSTGVARQFSSNFIQDRGYDRTFYVDLAPVPEPGTVMLGLSGIAMALGLRRFRR